MKNIKWYIIGFCILCVLFLLGYTGKTYYTDLSKFVNDAKQVLENAKKATNNTQIEIDKLEKEKEQYKQAAEQAKAKFDFYAKRLAEKKERVENNKPPESLQEASKDLRELGYDNKIITN